MSHINDTDLYQQITDWGEANAGEHINPSLIRSLTDELGLRPALQFGMELSLRDARRLRIASSFVDKDGDVWVRTDSTAWSRQTLRGQRVDTGQVNDLAASWGPFRFISGGWEAKAR